jgi:hypothetical protein
MGKRVSSIYIKEGYGESSMLSSEWERCPNCPPPCGVVPAACAQFPPLLAARDRALLLIGAAGGFRRSELVALDVPDVVETHGGLELAIRRSKADQADDRAGQAGARCGCWFHRV